MMDKIEPHGDQLKASREIVIDGTIYRHAVVAKDVSKSSALHEEWEQELRKGLSS